MPENYFYYAHYYGVQAMWLAGGERWERWYPAIRDELLTRQRGGGHWNSQISPEYATSMALIILQLPDQVVPIFQR